MSSMWMKPLNRSVKRLARWVMIATGTATMTEAVTRSAAEDAVAGAGDAAEGAAGKIPAHPSRLRTFSRSRRLLKNRR